MLSKTLLALISLSFLTACGGSSGPDNLDYRYDPGPAYGTLKYEAANSLFYCLDSNNCPDNVGQIFSENSNSEYSSEVGVCTGFLISKDIVATNSHCIPEHLKGSHKSCGEYLLIKFLKNGEETLHPCTELLEYSDHEVPGEDISQDYAFFKIKKTDRTPFKIHKNGIAEDEIMTIMKVNPLTYAQGGELEVVTCTNSINSYFQHFGFPLRSPWSEEGLLMGCKVIGGNSGSPVLNSQNKVAGIAQSYLTEESFDRLKKQLKNKFSHFDVAYGTEDNVNFTNLSCVKDPVTNTMNSSLCEDAKQLKELTCIDQAELKEYRSPVTSWIDKLPKEFLYKINMATHKEREIYKAEPLCIIKENIVGDSSNIKYAHTITTEKTLYFDRSAKLDLSKSKLEITAESDLESYSIEKENSEWLISKVSAYGLIKTKSQTLQECSLKELEKNSFFVNETEESKMNLGLTKDDIITDPNHPACHAL